MRNAMIIDGKDNVAVAIEPIAKGDTVTYAADGQDVSLTAAQTLSSIIKSPSGISPRENRWSSTVSISALPPRTFGSENTSMSTMWRDTGKIWKRKSESEGNIWNFRVIAARMGVWASAIRC